MLVGPERAGAGAVRDQGGPGQIRDIVRVQSPNRSRSMIVVGIVNDSIVVVILNCLIYSVHDVN